VVSKKGKFRDKKNALLYLMVLFLTMGFSWADPDCG
jgi:hypothetical protein